MTTELRRALAENRAVHAPDYRGGLSNHLPMCLVALERLGASAERMATFAQTYRARLEPPDPAWLQRCTDVDRDPTAFWARASAAVDGLAGAAFHGLIRLSYALEVGDDPEEFVHALAYLERENTVLLAITDDGPTDDVRSLLEALVAAKIEAPKRPTITPRLVEIAAAPAFAPIVGQLRVGLSTLDRLATCALAAYVETSRFTALHAFTATHALRAVLPWLDDPVPAVRALWTGAAACLVESKCTSFDLDVRPAPDWEDIAAKAIRSDDDHVAKFVFACRGEASGGGDDAMLRHAANIVATRGHS